MAIDRREEVAIDQDGELSKTHTVRQRFETLSSVHGFIEDGSGHAEWISGTNRGSNTRA